MDEADFDLAWRGWAVVIGMAARPSRMKEKVDPLCSRSIFENEMCFKATDPESTKLFTACAEEAFDDGWGECRADVIEIEVTERGSWG